MDDFDEVEEQNEEDLLDLGDSFASIELKVIYCTNYIMLIDLCPRNPH